MTNGIPGQQVEDYARRLAGNLGVRDFVYKPIVIQKGKGSREVSDGLLVAGDEGLILQVKSRDPEAAKLDPLSKAEAWCVKNAAAAVRQAEGTRRSLATGNVAVRSLRGFDRILPDASSWASVVIVDHPSDPEVMLPPTPNTLYISVNDWRNLHRWLRSTWGVIGYMRRAVDSGVDVALGREQDRYEVLAEADLHALGSLTSFPTLPPYRIAGAEAWDAALFEDLIERLADPEGATGWAPSSTCGSSKSSIAYPRSRGVRLGREDAGDLPGDATAPTTPGATSPESCRESCRSGCARVSSAPSV
jgi:hypothetical protein